MNRQIDFFTPTIVAGFAGLAVAASATAAGTPAVFAVNRVDCGGVPGVSVGNPITWAPVNTAFNPPFGGNFPPSACSIPGAWSVAYDSYVAIDPLGASVFTNSSTEVCGYTSMRPGALLNPPATPATPFAPGALNGVWFNNTSTPNNGFVESPSFYPGYPGPSIFIAQITLRPGTNAPTTAGVAVNIRDAGTANPLGETGLLRFGAHNATNNSGLWGQPYYLDYFAREVNGVNATFNGGTSYEIFVRAVPGPGVVGLPLWVACSSMRRRRGTG